MIVRKGLSGVEQKITEKCTYTPGGEKKRTIQNLFSNRHEFLMNYCALTDLDI